MPTSLSAFEKRVKRRLYGPKREEVTGGCRRLHNEDLNNARMMTTETTKRPDHVARMANITDIKHFRREV